MKVDRLSRSGNGLVNEDLALSGAHHALVIDGATAEPGAETGCVHSVRWLVARLGSALDRILVQRPGEDLRVVLRAAIESVREAHGGTCDLGNPCGPTATVAILRERDGLADYLVLSDSAVTFEYLDGRVESVIDDRIGELLHLSWQEVRPLRNAPGGFWVAGSDPAAADHALTGTVEISRLRRAALLTDGAYRLVERYGWTWSQLLDIAELDGPAAVIAETRRAERRTAPGRFDGKHHDDATIAFCQFETTADPLPRPIHEVTK
ncbi:protein phosphatase 2C domain-containing protein [Amycolatopsis sp. SID8362]|uniref:protein phosphatase 2C domain-containing protein n=1 Tax=Amycolatopsis sp. SID8362 TaxID=2690346 RepID=UPI00136B6DE6|nr:protein phosphatase 2C domain-containing protein [Amycolatopsis sp. SID8362]NBH03199.1 hypothetical protein [Amycolatopsis sp. SID8362]NED39900.1 protein phosphatase 2C domain-containing protein [Amycolatopsis sp. SID8362]